MDIFQTSVLDWQIRIFQRRNNNQIPVQPYTDYGNSWSKSDHVDSPESWYNNDQNGDDHTDIISKNEFPEILTRELGDTVHVAESETGLAAQFTIMGLEHDIRTDGAGFEHELSYTVEEFRDQEVMILDDAVFGILEDTGRKLGV